MDDIDRLDASEVKSLFETIKMNADFPRTLYLLAFDREIVEKNLSDDVNGVDGKKYLDKIVQASFDLPSLNSSKLLGYLINELRGILGSLPLKAGLDDKSLSRDLIPGFVGLFNNIRDVKRFINILSFTTTQTYRDGHMYINVGDFITLESLRVFTPDFYNFIHNNKYLFVHDLSQAIATSGPDPDDIEKENIKWAEDRVTAILGAYGRRRFMLVLQIMESLFPTSKLGGLLPRRNTFAFMQPTRSIRPDSWRSELRICYPDHFDKYFQLNPIVSEGSLSQSEVEAIFEKIGSKRDLGAQLIKHISQGTIPAALRELTMLVQDPAREITAEHAENAIRALLDISDSLVDSNKPSMHEDLDEGSPPESYILWSITHLIQRMDLRGLDLIRSLGEFVASSSSVLGPVAVIDAFSGGVRSKEFQIEGVDLSLLRNLCVSKMIDKPTEELLQVYRFGFVFSKWVDWDKGEAWRDFINEIHGRDDMLVLFACKFVSRSIVYSLSQPGPRVELNFHSDIFKTGVGEVISLDLIRRKLVAAKKAKTNVYVGNSEAVDAVIGGING